MAQSSSADQTRRGRGLALVLGGTMLSAASSFVVLLVVAPALGPTGYAAFSVYWGALFMVVAVLFGIQQETTRGVADAVSARADLSEDPRQASRNGTSVLRYATVIAIVLLALIAGSGSLWSEPLFGQGASSWGIPLAVAVGAYALVAAVNGILAGTEDWGPFALLAVIDAILRLAFVGVVLLAEWGGSSLAWAVALPFPLSLGAVFLLRNRRLRANSLVAEGPKQLSRNIGKTVTASAANAILINGFPVVLSLVGSSDPAEMGAVVLAVTLTRAPILVPLTALQSMLIARFSSRSTGRGKLLALVLMVIALGAALVAAFVWAWGGPLLETFFGGGFVLTPLVLASLVIAAGCLGMVTASGAAVLSAGKHTVFAVGWISAAVIAIGIVAMPAGGLGERVAGALIVGPLVGTALHLVPLWRSRWF